MVSAALSWAVDESLIDANPAHRIRQRKKDVARDRKLTEVEVRAI